jgi:hypothetical protein
MSKRQSRPFTQLSTNETIKLTNPLHTISAVSKKDPSKVEYSMKNRFNTHLQKQLIAKYISKLEISDHPGIVE